MTFSYSRKLIVIALIGLTKADYPKACQDFVYIGTDTTKSNYYCMDICVVGETDPQCVIQPAAPNGDGQLLVGKDQSCYMQEIYGVYAIESDQYPFTATPALCQALCQNDPTCVMWQWQYNNFEDNHLCYLKTQDNVEGALSCEFTYGTEFCTEYCAASQALNCVEHIDDCLKCDNIYRCVFGNSHVYTGWTHCGIPVDPCSAKPIPTECLDAIYIRADTSHTNRYCINKCAENGGTIAPSDHECILQPGVFDSTTGSVQIPPGNYLTKYVYGKEASPDNSPLAATPALCQELCQNNETCVAWLWEYQADGNHTCVQKTQEQIDGALAIQFTEEFPVYEATYCNPGIGTLCFNHTYDCLTCGEQQTSRCVYELHSALSGWKYSGIPEEQCGSATKGKNWLSGRLLKFLGF